MEIQFYVVTSLPYADRLVIDPTPFQLLSSYLSHFISQELGLAFCLPGTCRLWIPLTLFGSDSRYCEVIFCTLTVDAWGCLILVHVFIVRAENRQDT